MTKVEAQDTREIEKIRTIVVPWIEADPMDYQPWIVALKSGTEITVWCPLGAAVELELERGYEGRINRRSY
jgi:hypothetical protein